MKVFLFAFIAAIGNALFVYGQRGSETADNPFFFLLAVLTICTALFMVCAFAYDAPMEPIYLQSNLKYIVIGGVGFFITFIGFYWLYSQHGAIHYIVYALLSILTTSIGVGIVLFREPFNKFHVVSAVLAIAAISCYGLAQSRLDL